MRRIEGQSTLLARTMHSIQYDEIHDEIIVPQPFSQAILTFRGGANGEEPPIRVIQGPVSQLGQGTQSPDQLAIDPVNNEIYVPEEDAVRVYAREANGDVAPIRVLQGPDAMRSAGAVAVDPVHNLLFVTGTTVSGNRGLMIFERTAHGNAKPLGVITGPRTGLSNPNVNNGLGRGSASSPVVVAYPPRREVLVVGHVGDSNPHGTDRGFIGVWSIDDRGDVPPRWMVGGPKGGLMSIRGMTVDAKHKTVIIADMILNALLTYSFPEIF